MRSTVLFIARQVALLVLAALAYFGVRGLTEGNIDQANRHAELILDVERALGIDVEHAFQTDLLPSDFLISMANWIYIWGHWPLIIATWVWLAIAKREHYIELRNAMFISGAIGLVIFATFAVTPPRLFGAEYIDTVTERSLSYRVLQPPALVNKYAAVPSLHFGWNLLVGLTWRRVTTGPVGNAAGIIMPVAMGFAVIATGNHWTIDVIVGGVVALAGLALERARRRYVAGHPVLPWLQQSAGLSPDLDEPLDGSRCRQHQH